MAKSFDTQEIEDILAQLENMHPQAVCELDYKSPFELLVAVIYPRSVRISASIR